MKKQLMVAGMSAMLLVSSMSAVNAIAVPAAQRGVENSQALSHTAIITYDALAKMYRADYIHYAKTNPKAKPNGAKPGKKDIGYSLMGVKWYWQESFSYNFDELPENLNENGASLVIEAAAKTWDNETSCLKTTNDDLFDYTGALTNLDYGVYDQTNTVAFGDLNNAGIIAVTSIWYSRATKAIYEFDMCFNTAFAWSSTGSGDAMDLQNIATHEFGHAIGLNDIYNDSFDYVTMYGYASQGETNKTTLDTWDIIGLQKIYGE